MTGLKKDYTLGEFPVHTAAAKPEKLTIGRFLDIAQLSLGMGAYVAWLEAQDKKPDPLLKKGRITARRYRGQYEEGFEKFFGSLMERDDISRLKPAWRRAMRAGAPDVVFVRKGEFFKVAMPWLRMHQQVMRDLFTGKAYQIALRIAQAVGADDPMSTLAKLAVIPPASGLRIPRKWNEEAAKAVGAEPSTTESVMVDAAEAQAQAEKLRDVQTALDAAEPGSEEEAELGAEKAAIQSEIEEIAAESKDPSAVRATAVAASAEQPTSKIAQKAGLTPEQADALVAEGNIIITAGAGAGKTKTLAAKVAYFIEEKGYRPEQIMATSFTNASAAELKERVAAEFGITEANIGTTHSIAKQIIKAFRPDWEGALNAAPSGEINKLFRIAMAQTELTPDARAKRWAAEGREAAWGGRGRGRGGGGGGGGGYRNLYKDALGKWFNLGEKLLDQKGRPIGAKRLKNYIGKWKMGGWGPDQAWDFYQGRRDESMVAYFAAAVYGAYEYLKNDDAQFAPAFDFDDWLLKATEILEKDPRALESLQRRYKVVLVDEAQDLNATQHKMFGLIAAQADTFAMIGDDKQCVHEDTLVSTPSGEIRAGDLQEGMEVLSYRNGAIAAQKVRHVLYSTWENGVCIRTRDGRALSMSPNHKIWASEPETEDGQTAVYLMYRRDMGFRVGVTNKGKSGKRGEDYFASYGGRAFLEKAERMWILDIYDDREDALHQEYRYSLKYQIPTTVFNGEHRGLNQGRIAAIFEEFGDNGARLLENKYLAFDLPHWMSQSYTKHGRDRRTINLIAHSGSSTQVALEWQGDDLLPKLEGLRPSARGRVYTSAGDGRYRIRRWFGNYRDALAFAQDLSRRTGAAISERLSTPEEPLRLMTASGLFPGMRVAVHEDDGLVLDTIERIEPCQGSFVDIDVDDASNFFGGGILSHNSIYGFRGAVLEEMTSLPEKGFAVKQLALNFRSGASIVEAGNSVISHNTGQIPMKCYANVERKGMGQIRAVETGTHEEAAAFAANEIKQNLDAGTPLADEKGTPQFGILVRNNAEADAYALALMAHGIPFRTKTDFFNKPIIKAALAWLTINTGKPDEAVNDAICNAHNTPGFYLDKQFGYWMGKRCGRDENYLQYLLGGGPVYDQAWRDRKMVAAYREVVEQVTSFEGNTAQVLRMIMDIRGSKQSFQDSLIEQINPDDLADDLGREPTEEEIKEAALVPIRPVMRVADNFEDPTKMMDFIGKLQRANAKHRKDEENTEPAVQIGTVHGWKGLEAYNVWISMAGGVFPPDPELMARDATPDPIIKPQTMEDERRLAYVAITRGMDSVSIMSPRENYRGMEAGMSQFIDEACVGIEGYTRPEEDEEATQDSPPPGRSASEQPASRQLSFGEILDGFLKGATLEDFYEDEEGPETELEADWEYLP